MFICFYKKYFFLCFWLHQALVTALHIFVVAHRLDCPAACGILVPQPGIETVSPALEGSFLTTGSPGKSLEI